MKRYVVLDKKVGETPLQCMEAWRERTGLTKDIPLTYAGRLDPLASGKLLVLIGEECKKKDDYLALDKGYTFCVLLGISSDSGDILGKISTAGPTTVSDDMLKAAASRCTGEVTLPYPIFSSKTVQGKPLHTWAMEDRLSEIIIPRKTSQIYSLRLVSSATISATDIHKMVHAKIDTIPPVTELRKALGNDFRRTEVLAGWDQWHTAHEHTNWQLATFSCVASSGTYMRTLADEIAKTCHTRGLAWSIDRTHIGRYQNIPGLSRGV